MGKSSSSKRKRSGASSSVRSRKSGKSKRRRTKSKKVSRRRHDSDSWSSTESGSVRSLSSNSYTSSEDDFRRRRRRSRSLSRKDGRKSRKRVRRGSYSSDEGSSPVRKRKGSKRKGDSRAGRKSDKKYGRDARVSSVSYGSLSCSACASRSSSGDERESYRGRSERRESHVELRNNRSRDRSCSRSSCSQYSIFSGDNKSEERVMDGNNSVRLRSVVIVLNSEERKFEEERNFEGEGNKEEIVYDKDDYPSSRSNDSCDDESKKELAHPHFASNMKGMLESEKGELTIVSNLTNTEHGERSGDGGSWKEGSQRNSKVSGGQYGNDLESILRQRALENLQKFRDIKKVETIHPGQEDGICVGMTKPTTAPAGETELPRKDLVSATGVNSRDSTSDVAEKGRVTKEKDLNVAVTRNEIFDARPDKEHASGKRSGSASEGLVERTTASNLRQKVTPTVAPGLSNPWKTAYTWRREPPSSQPPAKELSLPQKAKPLQAKPIVTETVTSTSAAESGPNWTFNNQTSLIEVSEQSSLATEQSTHAETALGAVSLEKIMDEAKAGPQYEQKTMSITRGGETIQVNYQVYIPKRAPALARRQLKRDS